MKSYRSYKGSWFTLNRRKGLSFLRHISWFPNLRIKHELNRIKKTYHLSFPNPHGLSAFQPLNQLHFPYLLPGLKEQLYKEDQQRFFQAAMLDQLHSGEYFCLAISSATLEWIDIYLALKPHYTIMHYRYHIFDRYWQGERTPSEAMQIRATVNIYLDEILYLIAKNALFSPFRSTLKYPPAAPTLYKPFSSLHF